MRSYNLLADMLMTARASCIASVTMGGTTLVEREIKQLTFRV
jgi:hypothetical protein